MFQPISTPTCFTIVFIVYNNNWYNFSSIFPIQDQGIFNPIWAAALFKIIQQFIRIVINVIV